MPLPKGIACPTVAEEWMAERRVKVEEFDRLRGKGLPEHKAARALGTTRTGIKAMRASIERIEEGGTAGRACGTHIDLGLAILACVRKPDEHLTSEDIAAWCGCTRSAIQSIERRALAKVRQRLLAQVREPEMAREVESLLATFAEAA